MSDYSSRTEQEKFGKLANSWWDKDGPLKTLHDINPIRLQYIQQQISLEGKKVADIGCGGGILAESLAVQGAEVTGIDTSTELIKTARAHSELLNLKINYSSTNSKELAESVNDTFDVVICMELVEHVEDLYSLITDCRELLKLDGVLIVSTINRNAISYFLGIVAAEDILKIVPKGTHDYNKFVKPSELAGCCRKMKLENVDLKGLNYNPFTRKASISNNVHINYISTFSAH